MAILEIRKYPDPILRRKALPIKEISQELIDLSKNMIDTMRNASGIGLAANQVGYNLRLIVVDGLKTSGPLVVINPEIVSSEEEEIKEEGCLSIPGYFEFLKRSKRVIVKGIDLQEKELTIECEGIIARAFQHEIDHLDGILFIDRLSPIKRSLFRKEYKNLEK
ncbi:MAG: peptide deformylase [Deltaproteobacteria bacterium]|nr:peptide deformylase [Deltaproteobacteria bacterium]